MPTALARSAVRARLKRGAGVIASARRRTVRRGAVSIPMRAGPAVRRGRYTLVLTFVQPGGKVRVDRRQVSVR